MNNQNHDKPNEFKCCGGNDDTPKAHAMDCPDKPNDGVREFWIKFITNEADEVTQTLVYGKKPLIAFDYHVIEYSDYQALQEDHRLVMESVARQRALNDKQFAEKQAIQENLRAAVEALELSVVVDSGNSKRHYSEFMEKRDEALKKLEASDDR